jgi:hypothetical protein
MVLSRKVQTCYQPRIATRRRHSGASSISLKNGQFGWTHAAPRKSSSITWAFDHETLASGHLFCIKLWAIVRWRYLLRHAVPATRFVATRRRPFLCKRRKLDQTVGLVKIILTRRASSARFQISILVGALIARLFNSFRQMSVPNPDLAMSWRKWGAPIHLKWRVFGGFSPWPLDELNWSRIKLNRVRILVICFSELHTNIWMFWSGLNKIRS